MELFDGRIGCICLGKDVYKRQGQHDAEPGRSGKAGQPLQPLVPRRDVFALMDVGARHEEPGKAFACQNAAQIGKARRALRRVGGAVEGLKHAKPFHIGLNILG